MKTINQKLKTFLFEAALAMLLVVVPLALCLALFALRPGAAVLMLTDPTSAEATTLWFEAVSTPALSSALVVGVLGLLFAFQPAQARKSSTFPWMLVIGVMVFGYAAAFIAVFALTGAGGGLALLTYGVKVCFVGGSTAGAIVAHRSQPVNHLSR